MITLEQLAAMMSTGECVSVFDIPEHEMIFHGVVLGNTMKDVFRSKDTSKYMKCKVQAIEAMAEGLYHVYLNCDKDEA